METHFQWNFLSEKKQRKILLLGRRGLLYMSDQTLTHARTHTTPVLVKYDKKIIAFYFLCPFQAFRYFTCFLLYYLFVPAVCLSVPYLFAVL